MLTICLINKTIPDIIIKLVDMRDSLNGKVVITELFRHALHYIDIILVESSAENTHTRKRAHALSLACVRFPKNARGPRPVTQRNLNQGLEFGRLSPTANGFGVASERANANLVACTRNSSSYILSRALRVVRVLHEFRKPPCVPVRLSMKLRKDNWIKRIYFYQLQFNREVSKNTINYTYIL